MDTPSLTILTLFSRKWTEHVCCSFLYMQKHSIRIRKTKIFSLLNSEPQKTKQKKKNGRLSRAVRSVEFQKLTYEKKNEKQIAILYYLWI